MSDLWADSLYVASFGGIEFDCLTASDSLQRAIVSFSYARRDGGDLLSMGAEARRTSVRMIFFERSATEGEGPNSAKDHLQRYRLMYDAINRPEAQEFVHPITGTYLAMCGNFQSSSEGDARDVITADAEFIEDTTTPDRFANLGGGTIASAGIAQVEVQAEKTSELLENLAITTDAIIEAMRVVKAWGLDSTLSSREVNLQMGSISTEIANLIRVNAMREDVEKYEALRELEVLHFETRRAAELFREDSPSLFSFTVSTDSPLRAIASELYGGADAAFRYNQLRQINVIDDPGLIQAGTVLQAASPGSRSR